MIHILDNKTATFDYTPEILLQYVDLPRIFQKVLSQTSFLKRKLKKDGVVVYEQIKDEDRFSIDSLCDYITSNEGLQVLIFNIEILEGHYLPNSNYLGKLSTQFPKVKFIVTTDETSFLYSKRSYEHRNIFYIVNGVLKPFEITDSVLGIPNLANYYVMNDYLQQDYSNFFKKLFPSIGTMVRQKKYNFYNGVHKPHRLKSYEIILDNDMLDDGFFSYADFAFLSKDEELKGEYSNFFKMKRDEYDEYLKKFKIPYFCDTIDSDPNVFVPFLVPPQYSFQSYVTITTETQFLTDDCSKDVIFSEKSFKPFYGFNIPLIMGQPTAISYLKDLGFEMFDDLFDLSFKSSKNEIFEQFDKNIKTLKNISKDELHQYYLKNMNKLEANYELLTERMMEFDIENLNNFLYDES